MVDGVAELRVVRIDECYLLANSFSFHRGLTHLRLSRSRAMTLALVSKLQVFGALPWGHSPSSDPPLFDLSCL